MNNEQKTTHEHQPILNKAGVGRSAIKQTLGVLILIGIATFFTYCWVQIHGLEAVLVAYAAVILLAGLVLLAIWLIEG